MTPEIKLMYQLSKNNIFEVRSRSESDMKAWVANQQYLMDANLVAVNNNRANEFSLLIRDPHALDIALANDCNRFAQAAIESMWSITEVDKLPRSSSWAAVKMYYSSFFAVHAILRIFGRACTQLDTNHINSVYEVAQLNGMQGTVTHIENGFYYSSITDSVIVYKKLKDSHGDTWSSFSTLLSWIIANIDSTSGLSKHKSKVIDLASQLKSAISKSGASKGNWPSQLRNSINYQHSHGVWYPYRNANYDHRLLKRNAEWLKDPLSFDLNTALTEMELLFNVSNSILSVMHHLITYSFERSDEISYPFSNGAFRLLNQLELRG